MGYFTRSRALTLQGVTPTAAGLALLGAADAAAQRTELDLDWLQATPTSQSSHLLWRIENNEAATDGADYSAVLRNVAGENGATRYNNVFLQGYNLGPSGRLNNSEHAIGLVIESDYTTAEATRQAEIYWSCFDDSGAEIRPLSIDYFINSHTASVYARGNKFVYGKGDTTFDWFTLQTQTGPDLGGVILSGNSLIQYEGSVVDFLKHNGFGVLGVDGTTVRLGPDFTKVEVAGQLSLTDSALEQGLMMYESGNTRYGLGIASSQLRLFSADDGTITFGTMSTSDGTTWSERLRIHNDGRVMFGGTSSSFPALKRSSAVLQARLADDSGFAGIQGQLRSHANAVSETPTATHTISLFDGAGTEYKVLCVAA